MGERVRGDPVKSALCMIASLPIIGALIMVGIAHIAWGSVDVVLIALLCFLAVFFVGLAIYFKFGYDNKSKTMDDRIRDGTYHQVDIDVDIKTVVYFSCY